MLHDQIDKQGTWLLKYGGWLPSVILLLGYAVLINSDMYRGKFYFRQTGYKELYEILCLIVSLFGIAVRIYTIGYYPEKKSFKNVKGQVIGTINTTGSYSVVRHPVYLANSMIWLGFILVTGNLWFIIAYALCYWLYNERLMVGKEHYLKSKFGFKYIRWAENVPAFIPNLLLFKKPEFSFSWRKVFKNETGRLGKIFLVYFIFDMLCDKVEKNINYHYWMVSLFTISLIVYIVLNFQEIYLCCRKLIKLI